ncbi:unnamed protein product, partial [Symbiodinium sp. CCMP2592]
MPAPLMPSPTESSAAGGERMQLVAVEREFVGSGCPVEKDFRFRFGEADRALVRHLSCEHITLTEDITTCLHGEGATVQVWHGSNVLPARLLYGPQQYKNVLDRNERTREEFESLEESAWWMHEACMEPSDLRAYFGGEKELAEARAAADASDTKVVPDKAKTKESGVDPLEAERERIKKMSVKELKAYLDRHNTSHADLFEKPDLLARAIEVALKSGPEPPPGPAWMKSGDICRLCGKPQMQ